MSDQNIYDNQEFFDGYKKIRENPVSANIVTEKPALFSLCPNFSKRTVLDLGCGYGENCREFAKQGALKVVGIDISQKMLQVAKSETHADNVSFVNMSMNELSDFEGKFDTVVSSLAIHYIEHFDKLLESIYSLLDDNGVFIFSQEHPLTTAPKAQQVWSVDESDNILHYNLTDYSDISERSITWIVDNVVKYHRSFSAIFNALIAAGFTIEKVLEPLPDNAIIQQYPSYRRCLYKPDFLLIRARKTCLCEK